MNTRRFLIVILASVMLLPNVASAGRDRLSEALMQQMRINQARYGVAGQALLVMHDGEVIFRSVDGDANVDAKERLTTDHVFLAYSLSKLFTSTLIMQLVEQGDVDLDKPASVYLRGLPARWQSITVRQFLNHSSGVPEYFDGSQKGMSFPANQSAVFSSLDDQPLLFPPGTDTRYTGTNYLVLSTLLEAHYGRPYPQIAVDRIIHKLGLKRTWLGMAALPKEGVVTDYLGSDGRLREDEEIAWPAYSFGQSSLYTSLDDLARFLRAVSTGELVGKSTLQRLWQPPTLIGGRRGGFAAGWEYGDIGAYRDVGHDGGARTRVRILFKDSLDSDVYIFVYLTNGSARNVWSRTLVGSAMAVVAPDRFPMEALSEKLVGFALQPSTDKNMASMIKSIRANGALNDSELEGGINSTGYAIRSNLGVDTSIRVFELNTKLFPGSANTWDSLAEAHAARGDEATAKTLYDQARRLTEGQAQPVK